MEITSVIRAVGLAALLILLSACEDSNNLYEESTASNAPVTAGGANETEPADADPSADDSDNTAAESQSTDESDVEASGLATTELAQFITSDCGSLPISSVVPSNNKSTPAVMTAGQLVSGTIGAESDTTNSEHYWSIDLEPGHYHVVLDTERVDGALSNLGLKLTDLQDAGAVDLFTDGVSDYRLRSHSYFQVEVARTLILRILPNYTAEEYTFGVFENGTAVPSPLFQDCPTITPLSLDTSEALLLPQENSSADDRWYVVEFETLEYEVNSQAARIDGLARPVQYEFIQVDQFGQTGRFVYLGYVDEVGPTITGRVNHLKRGEPGPAWIRIQNFNSELNIEFTINES